MLRHLAVIAVFCAAPAFAETYQARPAEPMRSADPFVIAPDACGASRFAHLIGESYPLHSASLPEHAIIHGPADRNVIEAADHQPSTGVLTLEYRPARLNVVVDPEARILAIGCH